MRLARVVSLLAATLAASGCVPYPVYKQLQPEVHVRVVDAAGMPLAGAQVVLLAKAYPYGGEHHRDVKSTDGAGAATFDERREWRAESLMIHGWQEFFWNLCVSLPGYATSLTAHRSASAFDARPTVALTPGPSSACPTPADNR